MFVNRSVSAEKQEDQINKYISSTNKQLKSLNRLNDNKISSNLNDDKVPILDHSLVMSKSEPDLDNTSTRSSNAENYNPLGHSSPIAKQILNELDNISSPLLKSHRVETNDELPVSNSSAAVTDSSCLPPLSSLPSSSSAVDDAATTATYTIDESKKKSPTNLKYLVNKDFNQRSPQQPNEKDVGKSTENDHNLPQWFPDILKDHEWEESNSVKIQDNDEERETEVSTNDPYLSFSSNTVIMNADTKIFNNRNSDAEYKRYLSNRFENNLKNIQLPPLTNSQMFVPDTFMHKARPKRPSQLQPEYEDQQFQTQNKSNQSADSENPGSPLKLFGPNQDTFTRGKFTALLNRCDTDENITGPSDVSGQDSHLLPSQNQKQLQPQHETAQDFVHESNNLFDGLIGKLSSNNLFRNSEMDKSDDDYTSQSESDSKDIMYHSSPFISESKDSPILADGDRLYNNLKSKLGPTINLIHKDNDESTNSMTFSSDNNDDYTSMGEVYQQTEGEYTSMNNYNSDLIDQTAGNDYLRDDSPSSKYSHNANVTTSLDELQRNLNLGSSVIKRPTIDLGKSKVMVPRIKKNINNPSFNQYSDNAIQNPNNQARNTKINFISGDDYKDKIYDRRLKKYVLISEYNQATESSINDENEDDDRYLTGTFTLDELSDINNTGNMESEINDVKWSKRVVAPTKEVSFNLPNAPELPTEEEDILETDMSLPGNISFSESKSTLAQFITEISPFKSWDDISSIDLNSKNLTNLEGLNTFVPNLLELEATNNNLGHLKGIPTLIETMLLNSNELSNLTNFTDFGNLKYLNVSNNKFENLSNLTSLRNLRELRLSFNSIKSLNGLEVLTNLIYLDLSGNRLRGSVDFSRYGLVKLEYLDLKDNKLSKVENINHLSNLVVLNLSNNRLKAFDTGSKELSSLRKLSINSNKLKSVDLSALINLNDLKIDNNNGLFRINGLNFNIERISIKSNNNVQLQTDLWNLATKSSCLQKLEISGGVLSLDYFKNHSNRFANISTLNLSAMNLVQLPLNFSKLFPIMINLNLNFNKLNNLTGLKGLKFLRHLKILSNNITKPKDIIPFCSSFRHNLQTLDVRVNPINKGYHPFVFYNDDEVSYDENTTINEDEEEGGFNETQIDESTILNLETYEDIEAFSTEYQTLNDPKSIQEYTKKNDKHLKLISKYNPDLFIDIQEYAHLFIVYFDHIHVFDGCRIFKDRRKEEILKFVERNHG